MSLSDRVELYWLIECDECGESDDLPKDFATDAGTAAAHFQETGWAEYEGGAVCESCSRALI